MAIAKSLGGEPVQTKLANLKPVGFTNSQRLCSLSDIRYVIRLTRFWLLVGISPNRLTEPEAQSGPQLADEF